MEFSGTFLNQNDGVNLPNILIGKCLVLGALLFSHLGVLTHDKVGGVAGTSCTWKQVTAPLNFYIDQCAGCQLNQNVHDQERTILCETLGFIGQYTQDF